MNGGISAFLCTNLGNGPIGTPTCPLTEGTVTGVITPATVVGPANQGIAAREFDELVRAIRAGATYANIHTTANTGGRSAARSPRTTRAATTDAAGPRSVTVPLSSPPRRGMAGWLMTDDDNGWRCCRSSQRKAELQW